MKTRKSRFYNTASAFTLAIGLCLVTTAGGVDYVILKDGTILQGKLFKEKSNISDSHGKMMVTVDKTNGLQGIDDGPKSIFFGSIGAQIGESGSDANVRPEYKAYTRDVLPISSQPLPGSLQLSALEFDADWKTQFKVNTGEGNWQNIKLQINFLDPHTCQIVSQSHRWRLTYDTKEFGPVYARKLLSTHPELIESNGKPDAAKRIAIAQFMKDAGWLDAAKQELDKAKVDIPNAWQAELVERTDKLRNGIDRAASKLIAEEAEKALNSGRYLAAKKTIEYFKPELADSKEITRIANIKSIIDGISPRYEKAISLLRPLVDAVGGGNAIRPYLAIAGGLSYPLIPKQNLANEQQILSDAGEIILSELHPDSAGRLDLFLTVAEQASVAKSKSEKPLQSDEQLLALALTGWLKGKNGAAADVAVALRCWTSRQMMLNYQRTMFANDRAKIVSEYQASMGKVPFDELAQIISLLPPPSPVDVNSPGTPVQTSVKGVFQRNTGPLADRAAGVDYALRLPPEYQPGRAYPLLIAIGPANAPTADLVARLAHDADRNGYVVVSPNWAHKVDKNGLYDFSGDAHSIISDTLRDVFRRVQIDPDRVMLFGLADGASFALDMAAAHPDLFAAIAPFGAFARQDIFQYYWSNLQKVPAYCVTGELAAGLTLNYKLAQNMLKSGFPSLMTVYKGRAVELYSAEIEPMFDWFNKRVRPPTSSVVKPLKGLNFNWLSMRTGDNRFYWIQLNEIAKNTIMSKTGVYPAGINPDIRTGNQVFVTTRGVRSFSVLFERDMIDWTKPLLFQINGNTPPGYKPKILQPDLNILLEEFLASGDRKRLFLQKMTFGGY